MTKEMLLAFQDEVLVGVLSSSSFSLTLMIQVKKAIESGTYESDFDFNSDGLVNGNDLAIVRDILLGRREPDDV